MVLTVSRRDHIVGMQKLLGVHKVTLND